MQIKKERKQTYRYSYTQLAVIKPAKAPGQDSIGTGGQNSIGANSQRNIKDKESGLTTTVEVNKRVRQWWFVNRDTNKVALQLRYGTKVIEFAKGKNAIEVSSGEELISTLQKLRTATMSGELDESINSASLLVKARFKK